MNNHNDIVKLFEQYTVESDKFESKGIKASAARARKALSELAKLTKVRRAEIQEKKNAM
jgi:N-glycosylase/DNA lyase